MLSLSVSRLPEAISANLGEAATASWCAVAGSRQRCGRAHRVVAQAAPYRAIGQAEELRGLGVGHDALDPATDLQVPGRQVRFEDRKGDRGLNLPVSVLLLGWRWRSATSKCRRTGPRWGSPAESRRGGPWLGARTAGGPLGPSALVGLPASDRRAGPTCSLTSSPHNRGGQRAARIPVPCPVIEQPPHAGGQREDGQSDRVRRSRP